MGNCRKAHCLTRTVTENHVGHDGQAGVARQMEKRGVKLPVIKIISSNIRGLYPKSNQNKVPLLQDIANNDDITLMALTETPKQPCPGC